MHVYFGGHTQAERHRIHLDALDMIERKGEQMAPLNPYAVTEPGFQPAPLGWVVYTNLGMALVRAVRWRIVQ